LRARGERGLAPYVTAGDGGLETTLAVLRALDAAGAACVEL
jgi:tryptophan synthase alpha subunit